MIETERYSVVFYQNLGKLFYAIALADKHVDKVEYHKLREIVKNEWLPFDDYKDDYKEDAAYQIEIVFDWLYKNKKAQPNEWFEGFLDFKKAHEKLFTKKLNKLILKTAHAIANSFYGVNKSELIMLAKLDIELKKVIHEK
jgi:hypothetical protein